MPIILNRVDDRLIHGQVVLGWAGPLRATHIVVVDGDVRASGWEQDLYRMALPEGLDVSFASEAEAVAAVPGWEDDPVRTILVTGSLATMAALHQAHPGVGSEVNLGGIHAAPGRRQILPWLYLSTEEEATIRGLEKAGAQVTAQDVPATRAIPAGDLPS